MEIDFLDVAERLMVKFAYQTGLSSSLKPRRYLWTDAFAVCIFLELYRQSGDEKFRRLALDLVDQVHYVLGRHREDDVRKGWISGLDDEEGWRHPTVGGLRIGKRLHERSPEEPFDEVLEWERDGQYYHYLIKWMYALNRISRVTGNTIYNRWAIELAKKAHSSFVYKTLDGRRRIYWKMSIDLSRPLVTSMGQHDPLDGFVVYNELQASAPEDPSWPSLEVEIKEIAEIIDDVDWTTSDPLGIGSLLWNAYALARLIKSGHLDRIDLLLDMLNSSLLGLELYLLIKPMRFPSGMRLAFRELGLTIGLKAVIKLEKLILGEQRFLSEKELCSTIKSLRYYTWLIDEIEGFWLSPINRESYNWKKHEDINTVMLATSLIPDGFLGTQES
ncbi:TPA: hypothetical protein EYP70_05740 [Candidatus Bathyarchaeota archaeon]|nr:hypothetical protein [Candidatus Bathyarchaeota archaeon]